jgi:predicted metal-dependent hydrolase
MAFDNGETVTLRAPNGVRVKVRLEVNAKARRLILRLDERRREAVAVAPSRRQIRAAEAFARDRVDWITARLQHLPEAIVFEEGAEFPYRGEPTRITRKGSGRLAKLIAGDPQVLSVPGDEENLAGRVTRYLKKQARADFTKAVERHCATLGVEYTSISIKDTRSRWGSCTADGSLSFSWRLVMAPAEVLDYVAAHECAHLIEMNHSPRFWSLVSKCCPDWKRQRAWLRNQGGGLHFAGE